MTTTTLVHNEAAGRYELALDDEVASFTEYYTAGGVIVFPHTMTDPRFRGNGFAVQVVRFALDDVRSRGRSVIAQCWFVAKFIGDHPEYGHLVAPEMTTPRATRAD